MNEDLVWELKATHYKFTWFSNGAGTRSGMHEALVVATKFSIDIKIEDPEVPIRVIVETIIENSGGEHTTS